VLSVTICTQTGTIQKAARCKLLILKGLSIAYRYDLHVNQRVLAAVQMRTFVAFERAIGVLSHKPQ
jgi:hypothetical protein